MADLGKIVTTNGGTWNNASLYEQLTIVSHNDATYLSTQTSTNQEPSETSSYWMLIAKNGTDGADGTSVVAGDSIGVTNNDNGTQTVSYTGVKTIISSTAPSETENVLWVKPGGSV